MMVLGSLSNNDKLDLISKLSSSMRDDAIVKRPRPNLRTCFSGDWSNVVAEELRNEVTSNVKHFAHIHNIIIEDWARKSNCGR